MAVPVLLRVTFSNQVKSNQIKSGQVKSNKSSQVALKDDPPASVNTPLLLRTPYLLTFYHLTHHQQSLNYTTWHDMTIQFIAVHDITSYHIISYHIISHHITSYPIILHHITSYYIISHHIISYHIWQYLNECKIWTMTWSSGMHGSRVWSSKRKEEQDAQVWNAIYLLYICFESSSFIFIQQVNKKKRFLHFTVNSMWDVLFLLLPPVSHVCSCTCVLLINSITFYQSSVFNSFNHIQFIRAQICFKMLLFTLIILRVI